MGPPHPGTVSQSPTAGVELKILGWVDKSNSFPSKYQYLPEIPLLAIIYICNFLQNLNVDFKLCEQLDSSSEFLQGNGSQDSEDPPPFALAVDWLGLEPLLAGARSNSPLQETRGSGE